MWPDLRRRLLELDEGWEVWTDWYDARLRGDPVDWDLEEKRVLIPEEIWEQGPKVVNAEIARLIEAHRRRPSPPAPEAEPFRLPPQKELDAARDRAEALSRRTPLAETLEQDPETGRFEVRPREIARPGLLAATLDQLAEAVDDVVAEQTDGLDERSLEVIKLRRLLERHANDPSGSR